MSVGFVTVYETTDSIQAQMLADLLVQEGLDARLLGTRNAPLLGASTGIFKLRIEVPEHQVAEAAALVEDWETAPPLADDADVGVAQDVGVDPGEGKGEGEDEVAQDDRPHVSPLLAAGIALMIPGAAHVYARRPWTGACLAIGLVAAITGLRGNRVEASAAAIALLGIALYDLVGGQFAVRSFNRGLLQGFWRQVALGAGALVVVGGVAAIVAPRIPQRRTRAPLYDRDARHEMLRLRLQEMEKDQRIDAFPFPLAPLAGESAPAGK